MYKHNKPRPGHLSIHNEVVPCKVFHLGLVPLFIVEYLTISVNPYYPHGDTTKKVPNLEFLGNILGILSLKKVCFQSNLPILTPQSSCMIKLAHLQAHLA